MKCKCKLQELFEVIVGKVIEFEVDEYSIKYYPFSSIRVKSINWKPTLLNMPINDFFFLCKEWASKNGFSIASRKRLDAKDYRAWYQIPLYDDKELKYNLEEISFVSEREQEAVFLASISILERLRENED